MCAIAGIIGSEASRAKISKMLSRMPHRGPDHRGIYEDPDSATIGHNRLSIIDLSSEANEPFQDESGRFLLTFNGEIYNYQELRQVLKGFYSFRTSSDTEVLLAAFLHWGQNCLHKLNGMFSFGIWDNVSKTFFGARDRFGVKPFFYSLDGNNLYFSSEIKGIQAVLNRREANLNTWSSYFSYGSYGQPDQTFFENIQQLPGGHSIVFSQGKFKTEKWYNFQDRVKLIKQMPYGEAKLFFETLLKDSISLRFRADVPVGFNISGGVDSSLLLALISNERPDKSLHAYTFYTGDDRYDELPWVEEIISGTKNTLHKVKFSAEEVPAAAAHVSTIQDEPFGGIPTLAYAKLFHTAKHNGIKVLLDGQGMDEQWAGYDYYWKDDQTIQGVNQNPFRKNVLNPDFAAMAEKPEYPKPFTDELQNKQYRDLFFTKIPRALRFNDRISMAASTELREPFLDYRLVEFAFAQPEEFKKRGNQQKYMLRDILRKLAGSGVANAPKRPLQTPQREWLKEELKEFVQEQLDCMRKSPHSDWFDHPEIDREWQKYLRGENHSSFHLWQWINYSLLFCNNNSHEPNSHL